jgi:hypothetical protein
MAMFFLAIRSSSILLKIQRLVNATNGRVGLAHGMLIKAPSTSCEQDIKGHSTQTLYTFDPVTDEEEEK